MHPRCVGMGEMGLDFHYDNSPREIQKDVLRRQLKCVVHLGKSLTIHTREADDDILPILKEALPKNQRVSVRHSDLCDISADEASDTHSLLH